MMEEGRLYYCEGFSLTISYERRIDLNAQWRLFFFFKYKVAYVVF